jgi:hypothetical protein
MYLGGYAVECKLKAILMEAYRCLTLDQLARRLKVDERHVYVHGLEALAKHLPQLLQRLQGSPVWRDFVAEVNRWRPAWRYDPHDVPASTADRFLLAVERVYRWLESNRG